MKRVLIGIGVVILLLLIPIVTIGVMTFAGLAPLVDGVELPGGARTIKDGYVAAYLFPTGDKEVALIDCNNDANGLALMEELRRRGLGPDAVKAIFLTHGHADHIAGCHLFPGAEVMALPADVAVAEGTGRSKGPLPKTMDTPVEKRTKVTRQLVDGETVTIGSLAVKVYATPGHTAGSAVYLVNEALYFGDSASGTDKGEVTGAPWFFSDDQAQNQASLEALAKRVAADGVLPKKLVFAHTGPLDGFEPLQKFKAKN